MSWGLNRPPPKPQLPLNPIPLCKSNLKPYLYGILIFLHSIILFVIVFILSIFAVPWAKQQKNIAEDKTLNASEFSFITEGKFETFKNGDIVFYASESENIDAANEQNMEEILVLLEFHIHLNY